MALETFLPFGVLLQKSTDVRQGSIRTGNEIHNKKRLVKTSRYFLANENNIDAYKNKPDLKNLLEDAYFLAVIKRYLPSLQNVVAKAADTFGGIDVLINCAQASASGVSLADHTTEQFDLAIYSGLYGTFYFMQACYPYLKETKGSVINFASGAGLFGNFGQCSYAAAKEGIRGLSRVAATEWSKDGINVNVICPLAWTAQLENFQKAYPEAFEKNVHTPPMGYFGNPETDIGRVCVQLAHPDFKYLTGETLTLEGGLGLRP